MTREDVQTRLDNLTQRLVEQERELNTGRRTVREMESRCDQLAGAIATLNDLLAAFPPSANDE